MLMYGNQLLVKQLNTYLEIINRVCKIILHPSSTLTFISDNYYLHLT